ncbi:MAG: tetratricopeptide repeat protein, partial [Rhodospirillaceae bacterium]
MDLGFLMVPLTMAAMAFGFAVVSDTQAVHIDKIALPAAVGGAASGYTPDVFVASLVDEMHTIVEEARSRAGARGVQLANNKSALIVLADYLKVTPLILVAQESLGLIPYRFSGEITAVGKDMEIVLRGHGAGEKSSRVVEQAPVDQLPQLIKTTAYEMMRAVDPYIVAAYQFRKDFKSRDFTRTTDIIERELANRDSTR